MPENVCLTRVREITSLRIRWKPALPPQTSTIYLIRNYFRRQRFIDPNNVFALMLRSVRRCSRLISHSLSLNPKRFICVGGTFALPSTSNVIWRWWLSIRRHLFVRANMHQSIGNLLGRSKKYLCFTRNHIRLIAHQNKSSWKKRPWSSDPTWSNSETQPNNAISLARCFLVAAPSIGCSCSTTHSLLSTFSDCHRVPFGRPRLVSNKCINSFNWWREI